MLAVDASDNLWAIIRDPAYKGVVSLHKGANGEFDSVATSFVYICPTDSEQQYQHHCCGQGKRHLGRDRPRIAIISDPDNPPNRGDRGVHPAGWFGESIRLLLMRSIKSGWER